MLEKLFRKVVDPDPRIIVSIHIPKTGGSTFREFLILAYGKKLLLDHVDKPELEQTGNPIKVNPYTRIIHGHFVADKYDKLYPRARLVTLLRDPIERIASHYFFWLRSPDADNPICQRMIKEKLKIEEFAEMPEIINIQSRMCRNKRARDFTYIGIMEDYDKSIELFKKMFGVKGKYCFKIYLQNKEKSLKARYNIPDEARKTIMTSNKKDVELYNEGRDYFNELCQKYL